MSNKWAKLYCNWVVEYLATEVHSLSWANKLNNAFATSLVESRKTLNNDTDKVLCIFSLQLSKQIYVSNHM